MNIKTKRSPCILTADGTYFDFTDPESFAFNIDAIAHALSHICRFTGHTRSFYSVAQHSVGVSNILSASLDASQGYDPNLPYYGLMHDVAEAFLGDMSSPLKSIMSEYRALEVRVETAIAKQFGLPIPSEMPKSIREADLVMLATEKRDILTHPRTALYSWDPAEEKPPVAHQIRPMSPTRAYHSFLELYDEVRPK